ncbi:MAG: matrixin family metalloprotease [Candidatus Melainabacteria bacterium]|nr:matrixin family metalloprotease [Candidatus Melainabacteria bacterium]
MKRKTGAVYLAAFLVGSTQCGMALAAPAAAQKVSPKGKSTAKPAGWSPGLSNMMDQLESELGPKKGVPPASPPPDLNGPETVPESMPPEPSDSMGSDSLPPEPGTAGSDGGGAPSQIIIDPSSELKLTPPGALNGSDNPDDDDDDKPGAPAAVPMPPDNYQGLMPFGTGSGGTQNGGSAADSSTVTTPVVSPADTYIAEIAKSGVARWDRTRYPIKIYIEPTSTAKGFRPEFVSILTQAFKDWGKMIPSVPMEFVNNPTYCQITCRWTDNPANLVDNREGGDTILAPDDLGILHADMTIKTIAPKNFQTIPTNYMKRVALHEVGHALGLTGHSLQSRDIMFGVVDPKDEDCSLTARDQKTLLALYTMNIAANQRLDATKMDQVGNPNLPKTRALILNNEASAALKTMNFAVAETKLKEAHKLDPANSTICGNLGALYANLGNFAGMARNFPLAIQHYKQAIPLLELSNNKSALLAILTNYAQVLQATNNSVELKNVQTKIQKLK